MYQLSGTFLQTLGRVWPAAFLPPFPREPAPREVPGAPHRHIPALLSHRGHSGTRVSRLRAAGTSLPDGARGEEGIERLLANHPEAEEVVNARRSRTRESHAKSGGPQFGAKLLAHAPTGGLGRGRWRV